MDKRPIGIFDSGLGGLTAVRQILKRLPGEDVVYFGDTGRVPYGTRGAAVIERYAQEDSDFLLKHNVKFVIAACGTVSSVASSVLKSLPVPAIGVVEPTAQAAVKATENGKIGVLGTSATIHSGSFEKAIKGMNANATVLSQACPIFIPLVENGWIQKDDPVTKLTVERYLTPLKEANVDTLILGCTHFPILAPFIADFMGPSVTLVDAGEEAAKACEAQLNALDLRSDNKTGNCQYFVSDHPQGFAAVAEMFLGCAVQNQVEVIDLNSL